MTKGASFSQGAPRNVGRVTVLVLRASWKGDRSAEGGVVKSLLFAEIPGAGEVNLDPAVELDHVPEKLHPLC